MNSQKQWTSMFIKTQSSTSSGNQLSETSDSSTMRWPYSEPGETSHNHALERETSQPKGRTRWNPKPEQIRILEAIFQSGVVSPPREEIKRIRAQLEVFGQVGDANVFYWFQNRKSRSKRKPRLPAAQRSKSRTQSGTLSSTSSTSTSTSVNSKAVTEIYNSSPNSMHSNTGDQYYSTCATPVSAFAENDYDMQAVYKEMSKTSISVPTKTLPNPSNSLANAMQPNIGDQYCFNSAAPLYSSAGNTLTFAPPETLLNSSKSPLNAMPANIGDQYYFSSAAPVSSSVNSKTVTEIYNSSPNSMHSNTGDQYYATCATPVSAFAENDYDMQAVYEEMSKTSISVPTKTLPNPSNCLANAMQANIGDQFCFSSAAPLYSCAGNHYDHLNTSKDQYCFSSAAPLYSSAGNQYDHLNTSTSAPPETLLISSESPVNAIPANIGDQYCFSSAAPVSSSAGHHYDLHTVYDEMSNINELCNMQAIEATAAAAAEAQSIVNEGIEGVQEGSITNPNPSITVFINDVPTTIPSGPIKFGDFFGNDGLLLNSSGESVLVNEFGLTSLEHGATYFLI